MHVGVKDALASTAIYACWTNRKQLKGKGRLYGLCPFVCLHMCICIYIWL